VAERKQPLDVSTPRSYKGAVSGESNFTAVVTGLVAEVHQLSIEMAEIKAKVRQHESITEATLAAIFNKLEAVSGQISQLHHPITNREPVPPESSVQSFRQSFRQQTELIQHQQAHHQVQQQQISQSLSSLQHNGSKIVRVEQENGVSSAVPVYPLFQQPMFSPSRDQVKKSSDSRVIHNHPFPIAVKPSESQLYSVPESAIISAARSTLPPPTPGDPL
jgi:hypothetical protein